MKRRPGPLFYCILRLGRVILSFHTRLAWHSTTVGVNNKVPGWHYNFGPFGITWEPVDYWDDFDVATGRNK